MKRGVGFRSIVWSRLCAASSSSCTHNRPGKAPNLQTDGGCADDMVSITFPYIREMKQMHNKKTAETSNKMLCL